MDLRQLIFKLHRVNSLHRYSIHKASAEVGLYFGQPPVLEYLSEHKNCTQRELADHMKVTPASVAVSLKRLQRHGLIERSSDQSDMRCNRLSLTEKGLKLHTEARERFDVIDRQMFEGFSPEELLCFSELLDRISNNFEKQLDSSERSSALLDFCQAHRPKEEDL